MKGEEIVCFCFGYSRDEILRDVRENQGKSKILEKILRSKKAGICRCFEVHPEKR